MNTKDTHIERERFHVYKESEMPDRSLIAN